MSTVKRSQTPYPKGPNFFSSFSNPDYPPTHDSIAGFIQNFYIKPKTKIVYNVSFNKDGQMSLTSY